MLLIFVVILDRKGVAELVQALGTSWRALLYCSWIRAGYGEGVLGSIVCCVYY